jgi:hypothetical protein
MNFVIQMSNPVKTPLKSCYINLSSNNRLMISVTNKKRKIFKNFSLFSSFSVIKKCNTGTHYKKKHFMMKSVGGLESYQEMKGSNSIINIVLNQVKMLY